VSVTTGPTRPPIAGANRQLGRFGHGLLLHEEGRLDLLVALGAKEVETVVNERLVEVDAVVDEEEATVTGDLGACKGRGQAGRAGFVRKRAYSDGSQTDVPRSRSKAPRRCRTSWCAMMSVRSSG
jgi:hypothetical protein